MTERRFHVALDRIIESTPRVAWDGLCRGEEDDPHKLERRARFSRLAHLSLRGAEVSHAELARDRSSFARRRLDR
jgi:hypothetical protein